MVTKHPNYLLVYAIHYEIARTICDLIVKYPHAKKLLAVLSDKTEQILRENDPEYFTKIALYFLNEKEFNEQ
jgi:hypothetical protein